jgi:hypothetical protein
MSIKKQVPAIDLEEDPMVGIFHDLRAHTLTLIEEERNNKTCYPAVYCSHKFE